MSSFPTIRMLLEDAESDDLFGGIEKLANDIGSAFGSNKDPHERIENRLKGRFAKLEPADQAAAKKRLSGYVQAVLSNLRNPPTAEALVASVKHDGRLLHVCGLAMMQYASTMKVIADQVAVELKQRGIGDAATIDMWVKQVESAAAFQVGEDEAKFFAHNAAFFQTVFEQGPYAGFSPTAGAEALERRLMQTQKTHPGQEVKAAELLFKALQKLRAVFTSAARLFMAASKKAVRRDDDQEGRPKQTTPPSGRPNPPSGTVPSV
jgi:hypothetical protein